MEEAVGIKEAVIPTPSVEINVIREGVVPLATERQRAYRESRSALFNIYKPLDDASVRAALENRIAELDEAIESSPLRGAADRDGNSLGNLRELTDMALRELSGELRSKYILIRTLETMTEEEDRKVSSSARDNTREGLIIDRETGAIQIRKFPNEDKRLIAESESNGMRESFQRGKDRMHDYVSGLPQMV